MPWAASSPGSTASGPAAPGSSPAAPGSSPAATAGSPRVFGHPDVFALIATLSFLVARFVPVLQLAYTCPMKGVFGLPCATCGMTRAFVALAHLDLAEALHASPFGAALAGGAWLYALLDLTRLAAGRPLPALSPRLLRSASALGLLALLVNWAWLLTHRD